MKFKAAIIGLGKIGMGYDFEQSLGSAAPCLTHASSFSNHAGFDLVGGVDSDATARECFTGKFGKPAFASVNELMRAAKPEVVSVAVGTERHLSVMKELSQYQFRGLLLEKPVGSNLAEAREIERLSKGTGAKVLVNYTRRNEPGVQELRRRIQSGAFGGIRKGVVWYSKGLRNNGSHFVNLLQFLLGPVTGMAALSLPVARGSDREFDFKLSFGDAGIYFLAGREEDFSVAGFELLIEKGTVEYRAGGDQIRILSAEADPVFPKHRSLSGKSESIKTDLGRYQWHVAESLHQYLDRDVKPNSDLGSALETSVVLEDLIHLTQRSRS